MILIIISNPVDHIVIDRAAGFAKNKFINTVIAEHIVQLQRFGKLICQLLRRFGVINQESIFAIEQFCDRCPRDRHRDTGVAAGSYKVSLYVND